MARSSLSLAVLALLTAIIVAGCGNDDTSELEPARVAGAAEAVEMLEARTVVDVRTPAEYAAGHVAGAVNIDVEASDFAQRISELDPEAAYLLYCRSGRRSAIAAETMAEAGFTDIVDAGGLESLASAGAPIE